MTRKRWQDKSHLLPENNKTKTTKTIITSKTETNKTGAITKQQEQAEAEVVPSSS